MRNKKWLGLLAYVTGSVNQKLLLRNAYLAAENRILRAKLPSRLRLSDPERGTLAEIGKRVGRKALREVACVAEPDTILAWYRKLVAKKFDGSRHRQYPGRSTVPPEVEALVARMARENTGWGYDRIAGKLANLGHRLSDQTVGNILRRHGIAPAPKRSQTTSWRDFIAAHRNVLAGADFFTVEVLSWRGLVIARSATQETGGYLHPRRDVLHDRDTKFCASFRSVPAAGGVNAIPERWVRSLKQECLSRLILFGIQRSLSRREKPSRESQPIALPEPNTNSAVAPLSVATGSEVY
jgi:hypothetical protein